MDRDLGSHLRGIVYIIASFTLWVIIDAMMKFSTEAHLAPFEVMGIMCSAATITMLLRARRIAVIQSLWPKRMKGQLIVALLGLGVNYSNVIALRHLPLTIFYVSVFTAPMMIAILSAIFLKEPLGWLKFVAIVAGFAGVVIAINPFGIDLSSGDWIGYVAAFSSSVFFAVSFTITRRLTRSETTDSLVFFGMLFQVVVAAILVLFIKSQAVWSVDVILILLLAGVMSVAGNILMTLSVKHAPSATVAPFHYTQIITGSLVAYWVWHETPGLNFWMGAAIIVASGIYIARTAHAAQTAEIAPH